MRAVVQRVVRASVAVGDEVVSQIDRGLCVLVGITHDDTPADIDYIAKKILTLRLFEDENGKMWKKSAQDLDLDVLCVSQFTLYAKCKKAKPDFHMAMPGSASKEFYESFLHKIRSDYREDKVKDGEFGAYMKVDIVNDGPVTIMLDSNQREPVGKPAPKEDADAEASSSSKTK
ncbi:D-tyrosyl-tRNATyr deacylase 1 [Salpingoeca rosetta]|uniref:D-aminoacyl-tRNA deacylase n=1 Tax=Salpingoeca rosetta (strain ATCC 50818 / BSB-021) TaxID=946362 RepID=F2UA64_SALR5|nr:D-tyrosyl-tRNATyr deacylase 1 [Salpingoeca rosetta]EGD73639.1 D-tyrosyl-tRNATyr deacylase 1 [Salpingoeca rosetta]|eukprot:XP_004993920.1 D-tyrosyl-tRNATyr deacylase 1 [Salpingoeca rosetta]